MASTYTLNLGLRKPEHRDPDTVETWDNVLNVNFDLIDSYLGSRNYTEQNFILNSDNLCESLNKLDISLNDVAALVPTANQFAALTGPGSYPPTGANPYATINYVRISRKELISPEYVAAIFSPTPGGSNTGDMTSDSELQLAGAVHYRYNYYRWISSEVTLQNYDIIVQYRLPQTFMGFIATAGKALILDIRTESDDPANCHVDIELHKDGTSSALISSLSDKVSSSDEWKSERQGNEAIGFSSTDPVLATLVAGSVLNIRISVNSKDDYSVKVGALTIQGTW
jgi:hypothetical protein